MVFIGSWRPRRRGYGPYDSGGYGPPPGYGRRYRRGGGGCGRDICLLESGCCLAELVGCGPQLPLLAPSVLQRSARAASAVKPIPAAGRRSREWVLAFCCAAIGLYQTEISPQRKPCCRYNPTCSHYALEALQMHGLRRGTWLAVRRLVRCRPGAAGDDPVPPVGRVAA